MDDLDIATSLIAKLFILCEVPIKEQHKVFKKINIGAGDYIGSGYAFIDAYHKIYDEFLENTTNSLYNLIKKKIYIEQQGDDKIGVV